VLHETDPQTTILVAEEEHGFICDHQLQPGNPPDAPQLVPTVERVVGLSGGAEHGDARGFGTAAKTRPWSSATVRARSSAAAKQSLRLAPTCARPYHRWPRILGRRRFGRRRRGRLEHPVPVPSVDLPMFPLVTVG
jgi:hypothetical protein